MAEHRDDYEGQEQPDLVLVAELLAAYGAFLNRLDIVGIKFPFTAVGAAAL
jgi:hypothetical protein